MSYSIACMVAMCGLRREVVLVAVVATAFSSAKNWELHRLDESKYPLATCLDGSQGVYYVRRGKGGSSNKKVYVHMEGGGWCSSVVERACGSGAITSCLLRAKTLKGSTKNDTAAGFKGVANGIPRLSTNEQFNPAFHDWNHVFVRYCDGASFSGLREDPLLTSPPLYSRGNFILQAVIRDLKSPGALFSDATDVVVGGSSAGGLSTFLHVHQFYQAFSPSVKMAAIPDGGFFREWKIAPVQKNCSQSFYETMKAVYDISQPQGGLPKECIEAYPNPGSYHRCMFAANVAPTIEVPLFIINSKYDRIQIRHILGYTEGKNETDAIRSIRRYGIGMRREITDAIRRQRKKGGKASGAFLDSCERHVETRRYYDSARVKDSTLNAALSQWVQYALNYKNRNYKNKNRRRRKDFYSNALYPCEDCCYATTNDTLSLPAGEAVDQTAETTDWMA